MRWVFWVGIFFVCFSFSEEKLFVGETNIIKKESYSKPAVRGMSRYGIKLKSSEKIFAYMTYGKPIMLVFDYPIVQCIPSPPSYFKTIGFHAGSNYLTIMPIVKMSEEFDGSVIHVTLYRGDGIPDLVYTIEVVLCKLGHENDNIRIYSDDEDYFSQKRNEADKEILEIRKQLKSYQQAYGLSLLARDEMEIPFNGSTTYNGMKLVLKRLVISDISAKEKYFKFLIEVTNPKDLELNAIKTNSKIYVEELENGQRTEYTPSVSNIDFYDKNILVLGFQGKPFSGKITVELLLDGSHIIESTNLKAIDIKQDTTFRLGF